MALYRTYRITKEGERIDGVCLLAFINSERYYLGHIGIYRNGMIDCRKLVNFEEFKEIVRSGWVATQLSPGATAGVFPLVSFTIRNVPYGIDSEEFIKEVSDEIEGLNGRPMTDERCRMIWTIYQASHTDAAKEGLRIAFEAITKHNRDHVLRNMGETDCPIRAVLYPDVELCRRALHSYIS